MNNLQKMENTINGDIMKKVIFVICIIVFFYFFLMTEQEEIRIRIIANSNSESDQQVKKDIAIYLYENYEFDFDDINICDKYIKDNLNTINNDLNNEFNNVEVKYEKHNFYNKTYNGIVGENKEYQTLLITIGKGSGENFWGVLYSNDYVESTDTIYYKSFILELLKDGKNNV